MRKIKRLSFYEIFLPLFYFLAQYDSIVSNLGLTILLVYTLYQVIRHPYGKFDKYFFAITFGAMIIKIIQIFLYDFPLDNAFTSFFNIIILIVIIAYRKRDINISLLKKSYLIYALIFSVFIIVQSFQIYVEGQTVDAIRLLPTENIITWKTNSNRPLSLFKEPQMYSTYMFPLIAILLIDKKYGLAFYFSFMILLSASTTGIIVLLGIYMYILLKSKINLSKKLFIFTVLGISIILFINLPFFETALVKLSGIGNNNSDYSRLFKSFYTFKELPFKFKCLGIGEYNIVNFIEKYNYSFSWMEFIKNDGGTLFGYQTSFFGIFVENGFIYAIFYYYIMLKFFRKQCNNDYMKIIFIIMIVQSLSSGFYFNSAYFFYILLIYALKNKDKCQVEEYKND